MSTSKPNNNDTDPLILAQQARDAGIKSLRESRERHDKAVAERREVESQAEAERVRLEAEFATVEAEARRQEQLDNAWAMYDEQCTVYDPTATAADTAINELDKALTAAVNAFAKAVLAERTRDQASKPLRTAHEQLHQLDNAVPAPRIPNLRLHSFTDNSDPLGHLAVAAMLVHPDLADQRASALNSVNYRPPMPNVTIVRG